MLDSAHLARRAQDKHAPRYHFTAPEGWGMPFDPNGAIFWNGRYHLFYIFQDSTLLHHGHCWGHASSTDLVDWTFHPPALVPGSDDPETGIFSGGALVDKSGRPTFVYQGVNAGLCIATAEDDDLIVWRKSPHNPVIRQPKEGDEGWNIYSAYDPHAWLENDTYYVILGGRELPEDRVDTAFLFRSQDLVSWEYLHPFYKANPAWTDRIEDCSCPDFFPIGDRHALVCISHPRGARYYLGRYENERFYPEEHHRMNWPGGACFAPESLLDGQGRRIFWAWAWDQRAGDPGKEGGVSTMTLPRVLELGQDSGLRVSPAPELEQLRQNQRHIETLAVEPGDDILLEGIEGKCVELAITAGIPAPGRFGIRLRCSPDGSEQTVVLFDAGEGQLSIDTSRSGPAGSMFRPHPIVSFEQAPREDTPIQTAPFSLEPNEPLRLRIFLDHSMLEVFANERECLTQRLYPERTDSIEVRLFAEGGGATVNAIDAWEMGLTTT